MQYNQKQNKHVQQKHADKKFKLQILTSIKNLKTNKKKAKTNIIEMRLRKQITNYET